jgi:Zn-dependent peptidase ImmA (M78 family)
MLQYDISFINKKVDELLSEYDKPYKIGDDDPSVDVQKIAQEAFGVKIKFISPWKYRQKHAVLKIENGRYVLKINGKDKDNLELCRFNIAHELGHIIFSHIGVPLVVIPRIQKYNIAHEWERFFSPVAEQTNEVQKVLALQLEQLKRLYNSKEVAIHELVHIMSPVTIKAKDHPKILNYIIAHEWGRIEYKNNYYCKISSGTTREVARHKTNFFSRKYHSLFIDKWGREELADHFAANLLVPIYRFQFYLGKSDKELAEAFKVDVKCIKKREKELEPEMSVLTAAVKPLPIEKIVDPDVEFDVDDFLKDTDS